MLSNLPDSTEESIPMSTEPLPSTSAVDQAVDQNEWLWGWDPTPGIVSVWAGDDGRALVWRREPGSQHVIREEARFRPWLLLTHLEDLAHLGARLQPAHASEAPPNHLVTHRELAGPGRLRFLVSAASDRLLVNSVLTGATNRLDKRITRLAELDADDVLHLSTDEQYLVVSGRTFFRGLAFDDVHRLQFDLETTGLDPTHDRIFLIAVHDNRGLGQTLESSERGLPSPSAEADLIRRLVEVIRAADPDAIENHNLHGFDLPFLARRAKRLGVPLNLGRAGAPQQLRERAGTRGYGISRLGSEEATGATDGRESNENGRMVRYTMAGRELIDTLDAVRRYDFAARDLPGHGLKAVARHFGLATQDREYVEGAAVFSTWLQEPERVRRYALDDVREVNGLARLLGGAAFALATMAPRRYERLADAGPATGILDPLIVRAYIRSGEALPAFATGDGTSHSGAALYLFAAGVAHRVVKADVSSLYPSLMRQYRISPRSDRLGVLLALVDRLVEQRLTAKARARTLPSGSPARHTDEALSAAMKILVNSAYGYLGAISLTRLADVSAANEVTRRGRQVLGLLCRELAARGATLLEADTDGVYFAAPEGWDEARERALVAEVGALLPPLIKLEYEGRYAAMLSHEPKNYALLTYAGDLLLRGVAFRSMRVEPYGEAFLRLAIRYLLQGDVGGVHTAFAHTVASLRRRALPTAHVAALVRLTKTPEQYQAVRATRREMPYEALLLAGRTRWSVGEFIRIYRAKEGRPSVLPPPEAPDPRDYDVAHYVRLLRETFAARLARAFSSEDFATLFGDPDQPSLFAPPIESIQPVLTRLMDSPRDEENS
jgi:DNA polymerase, archaea type